MYTVYSPLVSTLVVLFSCCFILGCQFFLVICCILQGKEIQSKLVLYIQIWSETITVCVHWNSIAFILHILHRFALYKCTFFCFVFHLNNCFIHVLILILLHCIHFPPKGSIHCKFFFLILVVSKPHRPLLNALSIKTVMKANVFYRTLEDTLCCSWCFMLFSLLEKCHGNSKYG